MRNSFSTTLLALATLSSAATIPPADTISLAGINSHVFSATSLDAIDPRFTVTRQCEPSDLNVN